MKAGHVKGVKKNLTKQNINETFHIVTISYSNQDQFKDRYDQIYTIGYCSGFYSSLSDQITANGNHLNFVEKRRLIIFKMNVKKYSEILIKI